MYNKTKTNEKPDLIQTFFSFGKDEKTGNWTVWKSEISIEKAVCTKPEVVSSYRELESAMESFKIEVARKLFSR